MKVFELTIDELQYLHLASDHSFFKCGEEDENGDERMTEIKQDEFCDIVGCVEEILSQHFIKEEI